MFRWNAAIGVVVFESAARILTGNGVLTNGDTGAVEVMAKIGARSRFEAMVLTIITGILEFHSLHGTFKQCCVDCISRP